MQFNRLLKSLGAFAAGLLLVGLLAGCGGDSGPVGGLSGVVLDASNNPVANVQVYTRGSSSSSTYSSTAGSYLLPSVQGQYGTVYAKTSVNGVEYSGQNVFQEFQGEQTKSVNIVISQTNQQGQLTGTVRDRQGNLVGGAQIFALGSGNSSSLTTVSDNNGNYTLDGLVPNVSYTVAANALGYDSDTVTQSVGISDTEQVNFSLNNPSGALLNPPTSVYATAFTSPAGTGRSGDSDASVQNLKRIFSPKVYAAQKSVKAESRTTPNGGLTEIDVTWNQATDPALYGWGIYRTQGTGAPSGSGFVQFYYDPLANMFADLDQSFLVGQTYTYAVTSVNTLYGMNGGDESPMSADASATVLGDMVFGSFDRGSMTFNWFQAQSANSYTVALFDQYPTVGVNTIWTGTSTGTSLQYTAGNLVSGRTYYYAVVGSDDNGDQTFSSIAQFQAP